MVQLKEMIRKEVIIADPGVLFDYNSFFGYVALAISSVIAVLLFCWTNNYLEPPWSGSPGREPGFVRRSFKRARRGDPEPERAEIEV